MAWLYLDDERVPKTSGPWVIVRSFNEAVSYVSLNGIPEFISFDHDIHSEPNTGYTFALWLIEQDLDGIIRFPSNFKFNVHSANPIGKKNIESVLKNYLRMINNNST